MSPRDAAKEWYQKGLDALTRASGADTISDIRSDHEEAVAAFGKAVELDPEHVEAWALKETTLFNLERYEEGLAAAEQVVRLRPEDYEAWLHKAAALDQLARYGEALAAFDRVLALAPTQLEAAFGRATALSALGWHEEALAAWDRVIASRRSPGDRAGGGTPEFTSGVPEDVQATACHHHWFPFVAGLRLLTARFRRGDALASLERRAEALAQYREACRLAKEHLHGPMSLYGFHASLRGFPEARQAYIEDQLQCRPEDAPWKRIGHTFLCAQRPDEALHAYEQAIARRPQDPDAWWGKAEALVQAGKRADGLTAFRRALEIDPDFGPARARLEAVLRGQP